MHTIDAGDVPLETIVHKLLSPVGLRKLIGHHGVACFVLARGGLSPKFFESLIEGVHTIDATTRHHVAFLVFHGSKASLLENSPDGLGSFYEHHILGLSATTDTQVRLDLHEDLAELRFNDEITNSIRFAPPQATTQSLARATELAVTYLTQRYNILESMLPCLLFVDGARTDEGQLVRLSPTEPVTSLYKDVLMPMSDSFRRLENYWNERRNIAWHITEQRRAVEVISTYRTKMSALENALLHAKSETAASSRTLPNAKSEEIKREREVLNVLVESRKSAKTLEEKLKLIPPTAQEYSKIVQAWRHLAEMEKERKGAYCPSMSAEEREKLKQLSTSINRVRRELSFLAERPYAVAREKLQEIDLVIRPPSIEKCLRKERLIQDEISRLNQTKGYAETTINRGEQFNLASKQRKNSDEYLKLQKLGFGDEVLLAERPKASDVIRTLIKRQEIGARDPIYSSRGSEVRILFLAANPQQTTQLDLEEELRAIENELRGVSHRDQIKLVARHAVRPDDLVKHIRTDAPDVVHFSGHGTSEGIVLRDDAGGYVIVRGKALTRLLKNRDVRLVVLNSCFSDEQAVALSEAVDTVIGTTKEVGDEAARRFSVAFYRTLGEGHQISDAFRDGGDAIDLHDLEDVYRIVGKTDVYLFS
jgi:hypothetical protein